MRDFTSTMKLLRKMCNWSQLDMARELGVSPSRYVRLEHGVSPPRRAELHRLLEVLAEEPPDEEAEEEDESEL